MTRSRFTAGVALTTLLGLFALAPAAGADEALTVVSTDVGAYPDVRMVVAVPAVAGDHGIDTAAVTIIEAGRSRPVTIESLPAEQLEVALVIDTSGSMQGAPLTAAKAAAQAFVERLPASVPLSVIGFGASPSVASARSANRPAQLAAIRAMTAGGQTALYDALGLALAQLQQPGAGTRRMAVLLTDGGDTASAATLEATAGAMAAARVPLFAVELRTNESSPAALERLTSRSGGRVVPAADPAGLAGAFDTVAGQLVRQHAISYRSEASGGTAVEVAMDLRGTRATARVRLDLPPAPRPAPAARRDARPAADGSWTLVAGGALFGAGLLGLLLAAFLTRTPRARGLTTAKRGFVLADVTDRAESMGDTLLRRRGGVAAVARTLDLAGVDLRPGELLAAITAGSAVLLAAGWVFMAPAAGVLLAALVPVAARVAVHLMATQRRQRFNEQLGDTLQLLAGSLRAGHGLAQSIDTVARESDSPTAEEFRRLTIETRLGRDFVESMAALADRMGSEDFEWVVQAVQIQREVGGDLAEILDTVASTVRDRTRIRRQVAALSAEGRISAWVLMVLPFGLGGMMALTNGGYLSPLYSTATGLWLLAGAAALLAVGGVWLHRIVKPTF
jgi:tight adherence protein B